MMNFLSIVRPSLVRRVISRKRVEIQETYMSVMMRRLQVLLFLLPQEVALVGTEIVVDNAGNIFGVEIRGSDKAVIPLIPPFVEKIKNSSLSESRGSIVKSIGKLASSIALDEASTAANVPSASMIMLMQMQQESQQLQQQIYFQQAIMQREVEVQIKGVKVWMKGQREVMLRVLKEMKKRDKKEKKKARERKAFFS
jgi:hypothetical protein